MKRYLLLFLLFFALKVTSSEVEQATGLDASSISDKNKHTEKFRDEKSNRDNLLEARAGYFFFTNTDARRLYHNGTADVELEYNYWFTARYSIWTNLNFIWKSGKTKTFSTPSHIDMATLSLGVKEFFLIGRESTKLYLGLGITGAYVRIKDQSAYLPQKVIRYSPGCVGKFGFLFQYSFHVLLDLFFDYYFQPTSTRKSSSLPDNFIDLGGFRTGGGLGYFF